MKNILIGVIVFILIITGTLFATQLTSRHSNNNAAPGTAPISPNVVILDRSGKGITKVSSAVYSKTDTTTLLLSDNAIQALPSQMGKMTNVTVFKIDHNQLEGSLIGEIRQMSQLKTLDASYNNMTGIPAELGQLHSLETLSYSHNKITGLPNELAQLKNNLKEFDLTGNPLTTEQISKLRATLPNTKVIF